MRVAIYARVSTQDQSDRQTIESQLTACREYCETKGHQVIAECCDPAVSGTIPFDERPAGRELLTLITAGEVEGAVCYCPDRLGRNTTEALIAMKELKRLKASVEFCTQSFDATPEGAFQFQVLLSVAELERGLIARRTKQGRDRAVANGAYMASVTPFGYDRDETGALIPHPENADVIRSMFAEAAAGAGLSAIAARLESEGVTLPLPPGKQHIVRKREWHVSTVYKMLTAPRYVGRATYKGRPMACPALIDEETFTAVQQALAIRGKHMTGRTTTKRNYLLRRLVYCRACGGPCRCKTEASATTSWTSRIYECRSRAVYPNARAEHSGIKRRWRASLVEDSVKRFIIDLIQNPEHALRQAKLYETDVATRIAEQQRDRDLLAQRLRDVDRQEARVLDGWRKGIYRDEAQFDIALASVREERAALESECSDVPARPAKRVKVSAATEAVLIRRAVSLMKDLPRDPVLDRVLLAATPDAQWAEWIRGLIRRVWLEPDGKTITVEGSLEPPVPSEGSSPRS